MSPTVGLKFSMQQFTSLYNLLHKLHGTKPRLNHSLNLAATPHD